MLERLRVQKTDLNQREFSEACGVPYRTYQNWISGKNEANPNLSQVKAICAVLGISIEELPDTFGPVHAKLPES